MASVEAPYQGTQLIDGSTSRLVAVTKSDSTTYTGADVLIALYVGDVSGGATVICKDVAGTSVTFQNVPVGTTLTGKFSAVMSTGTTAAGFIGYQRAADIS